MTDKGTKNIESLEQDFSELQGYADTQFHTIKEMQNKISSLESENRSLRSMLNSTVPNLELTHVISNEQLICETQIVYIKEAAITRPLTMEESKKFQIFVTVLEALKNTNKDDQWNTRMLTEDELIKLAIENNNDNTTNKNSSSI